MGLVCATANVSNVHNFMERICIFFSQINFIEYSFIFISHLDFTKNKKIWCDVITVNWRHMFLYVFPHILKGTK